MTIKDLINTNHEITQIDIYNMNNCFISSLTEKDFKNNKLLNIPIKKWYIASITITSLTLCVSLDINKECLY